MRIQVLLIKRCCGFSRRHCKNKQCEQLIGCFLSGNLRKLEGRKGEEASSVFTPMVGFQRNVRANTI